MIEKLRAALADPNVRAFLHVIRAGRAELFRRRSSQRAFKRPILQAPIHRCFRHTNAPRPLSSGHRLVAKTDLSCGCSVVVLLPISGPSAVFGRVPKIVIYTVKRHARRRVSHVSVKCRRVALPPCADGNSTSSVPMEALPIGSRAPIHHAGPRSEPRLLTFTVRRLQRPQMQSGRFTTKAPARLNFPIPEMPGCYRSFRTAIASAKPSRRAVRAANKRCNREPSKSLACHVYEVARRHINSFYVALYA